MITIAEDRPDALKTIAFDARTDRPDESGCDDVTHGCLAGKAARLARTPLYYSTCML